MTMTFGRAAAALLATTSLTFALAACSPEPADEAPAVDTVAEETTEPAAEETTEPAVEDVADVADAGSSAAETLDTYVALVKDTVPSILESFDGVYDGLEVTGEAPGTVVYTYTFADHVDPAVGAESLDAMVSTLQELCDSVVFDEMAAYDVTEDPTVVYTYLNPDGSEIWSHSFVPSA
ncbi:DUF4854 domain-containing protein [Demequina gelatinilytica]|uniref:DUF4854 domain-containing protein n=1 Tax=Demequina gelatinilytica TaxID=1638980 RepID=UPI00078149E3|nr:hypothetical protein [Demequina gelatinilytica]